MALVARDRATIAELLAHLAEVDERRLYLPAAHPSMYSYCVHELRLSEDSAFKRIRAARAARQFPAIFGAVADGRLHVTAVVRLAPYLTPENADELLAAAAHKSKSEIEQLVAERFPRPDVAARVEALPTRLSPPATEQLVPEPVEPSAPGRMSAPELRSKTVPLAPQRFALQLTMSRELHDKLGHA